jgi:hypothetical protein
MTAAIKQVLFTDWHLMRWLMVQAIQRHDGFAGAIAIFLLFQVITNTGCCGSGGCDVPRNNQNSNKADEGHFDEVK